MDRLYMAALTMIPKIGVSRLKSLMSHFGSARQAWQANRRDLFLSEVLDYETCNNLLKLREKIDVENMAVYMEKSGIKICVMEDMEYPKFLSNIFNPPLLFYYRGNLSELRKIAIVGSRQASSYGKSAAKHLAAGLAEAGICVVSGAARGIDTAAHYGALATGCTVAVLGCGVDVAYPAENRKLLEEIAIRGAVIAEYPPGTRPHPSYFPARNRIISGLAEGVVVVEAAEKSGALITAEYALEEGRDVFAVPGSIFSKNYVGVHRLIKQGAKLVDNASDILEEYDIISQAETAVQLAPKEQLIYDLVSFDNQTEIDEIVLKTNLSINNVSLILLQLQLRGLVMMQEGRYVRAIKGGSR